MAFTVAAIVTAVVAAAVSAYAAYEQGQTQKGIAKYNQKIAQNDAIARRQAADVEAQNKRKEYAAILGAQRAGIGGSGVMASEGSPLLVQLDSAETAALNEARIRHSGEVGAQAQESEAIIQGFIGKRAMRQGYLGAGASLLQGASAAAGAYANYSRGGGATWGYSSGRPPDAPGFGR